MREFESVLYGRNFDDPVNGYAQYIDVDSWIDTWLLVEFTKNIDGFRLSTYYHKDRNGKIRQGPAWDFNLSLANANYLRGAYPTGWYHDQLSQADYPYWDRLFADPNFEIRVRDRWFELRETIFSTENLQRDIDQAVGQLTDENPTFGEVVSGDPSNPISRNYDRWGTLRSYLWPNCFFGTGGCPSSPLPGRAQPSSYADYIFIMKDFIEERAAWIDGQFRVPPEISAVLAGDDQQTWVALSADGGDVYYTLDGNDPRDWETGDPSASAVRYESPFPVTENAILQTRTLRSGQWSAKSTETFFVEIPAVTISELNYNPAAPSAAETAAGFSDNEDFEFFELLNYGDDPIDVGGMTVADGVEVTFEPFELLPSHRVVVVRNESAFRYRYGEEAIIVGQFGSPTDSALDFKLQNSGERLVLQGALGEPILDFTYQDDWFPWTDGEGFTLVLRDPATATDLNQQEAWMPSEFVLGSPGLAESGVVPRPGEVVINEVLGGEQDVVELWNRSDRSIALDHFLLTSIGDRAGQFVIPAGATISPNGFLLLDSSLLGADFELDPRGATLTLRGALADGTLTGFLETVEVGTLADRSWGRVETSTGVDFAPLSEMTIGSPNATPAIGPVVLNELQYHPREGGHEFVELHNVSDRPISLAGWRLDEGIRFEFPSVEIPAQSYLVLLQVDHPDNDAAINDFRASFGVPSSVPVLAYNDLQHGSLNNAGEVLVLQQPLTNSSRFAQVDRVAYSDEFPWSARADGLGPSLSRIQPEEYGNEATNWTSSVQQGTPGQVNEFEDSTPPSVPAQLALSVMHDGDVGLGWLPASEPDSAVDHYVIYRDGRQIGTSPIPYFRDAIRWTDGAEISYRVSAVNADGFASDVSEEVKLLVEASSFQQGISRYSAAADARIRESVPDTNESGSRRITVDGNAVGDTGDASSALLRWSDIGIPEDTRVVGVAITLNITNAGDDFVIRPLLRPWAEAEVTWNQAAEGQPWQQAGAMGADDVGQVMGVLSSGSRTVVTTHLDEGIETIQSWIDDAGSNHGIIIADAGNFTDSVTLETAQATNASLRPKLWIYHTSLAAPQVGDFNFDGHIDAHDIDAIQAALRAEFVDHEVFDLDGDGELSGADVDFLLSRFFATTPGDANLDGTVDFADFLLLSAAFGKEEPLSWLDGDFNGDGSVAFADFLVLSTHFG